MLSCLIIIALQASAVYNILRYNYVRPFAWLTLSCTVLNGGSFSRMVVSTCHNS